LDNPELFFALWDLMSLVNPESEVKITKTKSGALHSSKVWKTERKVKQVIGTASKQGWNRGRKGNTK